MLIGHDEIQDDFRRLAKNGNLAHAYIFFGPSSVGKFAFARGLASLLETGDWEPASEHPLTEMMVISPEGGSIGIDEARRLKQFLSEKPALSSRRTAIIDGADSLTSEAQNALLKIAEEPPQSGLLILILRDPEALAGTLVSRFQKIYFGTLRTEEIAKWLKAQNIPAAKASRTAEAAHGKPGLALRMASEKPDEMDELARKFLAVSPASRKDFLKALIAPEDFSFKAFLDALISVLAEEKKVNGKLWHSVLELRATADATGLNPSIQLRNIWTLI